MCAYPEHTGWVFIKRPDDFIGQAVGIIRFRLIMVELFSLFIDFICSPSVCAQPQCTRSVFKNAIYFIVTQAVGILRIILIMKKLYSLTLTYPGIQ